MLYPDNSKSMLKASENWSALHVNEGPILRSAKFENGPGAGGYIL